MKVTLYHANYAKISEQGSPGAPARLRMGVDSSDLVKRLWTLGLYDQKLVFQHATGASHLDVCEKLFAATQDDISELRKMFPGRSTLTRSTSCHDVICVDGQHYICAAVGFTAIELAPHPEAL